MVGHDAPGQKPSRIFPDRFVQHANERGEVRPIVEDRSTADRTIEHMIYNSARSLPRSTRHRDILSAFASKINQLVTVPFEFHGLNAVDGRMHINDLHATLLALMGLNHEKLTYRYAGRDFRLTNIAGRINTEIFA